MKSENGIRQEIKKYVPLLLLPILFSIFLYIFVQNFTQQQLKTEAEKTLDLFYMQMSSMTRETENIAESLSGDFAMLDNLSNADALPYSFSNPHSVCRQIEIRKSDSPYIDCIYFVSDLTNIIYSDQGYFTLSSLNGILSGINLEEDEFLSIDEAHWDMSTEGLLKEPFYIVPLRNDAGEITGRFLFTISLDQFVETISSLNAEYSCLYAENFLIVSRTLDRSFTIDELSNEQSVSALLGKTVKCFYVQKDSYTYLVAFDVWDYYAPLIWMIGGFLTYAAVVLVTGYLYLLKVSKARHAEITTLIHALPQDSSGSSPAYRDLVPTIQAALLNAADLREKQRQLSRDYVLHSILYLNYRPSQLKKYAQQVGIPTADSTYYLARFYVRKWDNIALAASAPEDSRQMTFTIFKAAADQFKPQEIRIFCDDDTDAFNALFCGSFQGQTASVEATCESICKFMYDEYGTLIHASVSNPGQMISQLPDLLRQTQRLESYSMSINSTSLVISERLLKSSNSSFIAGNFFRQQMTLSSTLLAKKYDLVPAMVASILEEHVTNNSDYDLAMSRLKVVSNTLAEALLTVKGVDLDLAFYAQRLRGVNSVSELNADVEFAFRELDSALSAAPASYREVDEACKYIKANLDDKNLNVTMISEAVGTIPQRLTPMFQKQLNMGIAEYVNHQRIERATKLLTTTKLKVNQIADLVGYCNTDTFTRNFRKLIGSTPTEYRQMSI